MENFIFKALIVEVVIVAVGVFATALMPETADPNLNKGGLPGSMAHNPGVFLQTEQADEPKLLLPKSSAFIESTSPIESVDNNCHQITISDASTFPPTSHIETICN